MNNALLSTVSLFISLHFLGCTSIKSQPPVGIAKSALLEKESFRFQLPIAENAPVRPLFPKIISRTLNNGLTVLIVEDKSLPIAQISVVFKNGSARDPATRAGLLNVSTLMLKEGTTELSSLELAEAFANLGTEVSVGAAKDNAFISASVLSHKVDEAVSLLAAMVERPRLAAEDFARVKLQQQSSVASDQADPSYLAQVKFLRTAYGDSHPYSHPSAGTPQSVGAIALKDVKNAYKNYFGPNNAALVVVGDVSVDQIMEVAHKNFGKWRRITEPRYDVKAPKVRKKMQTLLVEVQNMPQTYLLVGQPAAQRVDKDLASYEVFLSILARDPTSRLNAKLREEKGWTYGVKGVVNPLRGLGPVWISTSIQVPFGSEALGEILSELEELKNTPVSDIELKSAKEGILHSFGSRYSTIGKVVNQVAELFIYGLPLNSDEIFYDQVAKVSKKDIMTLAQKVLKKDQMVAIAVGDLEAIEIPLRKMDVGLITIERTKNTKLKAEPFSGTR